ncbi:MAG TPA: hypothetical protein VL749_11990 [Patescibacteria group bacterium]|nr:hypothetical protein [Patescibacteria group bacterium]
MTWPTLGQLWTFLGVFLPALAALLVPMPAVDLAYQLRAGADILAGHGIPDHDTWTFTVAGTPWLDQQWGAQVLLSGVFQVLGWTGLAMLRAALVGLTFWLVLGAIRSAWSIASVRAGGSAVASSARTATLITVGFFVVAAPALALRPQLFAIVLFAATLRILVERSRHPRRLWLIPFMAAAWANLHGSFPLVVVLVALAWIDEVALLRVPAPPGHPQPALRRRLLGSTGLAIIAAVSALATLVNPFGVDAWAYIVDLARDPEITTAVSEWQPPSPLDPAGFLFYLSLLVLVGVVAFRFRTDKGGTPARFFGPLVSVLLFGLLGVITGRGLAWWAIAAPVAMVQLQPGLKLADVRIRGLRTPTLRARTAREASASEARRSPLNMLVMAVLVVFAVALLPIWRPTGPAGVPVLTLTEAPQGIAHQLAKLARDAPHTSVWAPQTWGSFIEWAVPEVEVAVDSRIELFPGPVLSDADEIASASPGWLSTLDVRKVSVAVVASDAAGDRQRADLAATSDWKLVYEDDDGSVWQYAKPRRL